MSQIYIRSVSKSFGNKNVLDKFSAELPLKGITVVMGESGCGKTTLINIMMGFETADSGEILSMPKRISAVFQDDCLCEDFSALSNLRAVTTKKRNTEELIKCLENLGLSQDDIRKPIRELSGGMKRRVAIARALIADGDYVIMDEPFKGLDEELRKKVAAFVSKDTKAKQRGLLVITHDPEDIELLSADQIIRMT